MDQLTADARAAYDARLNPRMWIGASCIGLAILAIVGTSMWFAQQVATQLDIVRTQSVPAALHAQLAINAFEQQRSAYQDGVMTGLTSSLDIAVINEGQVRKALSSIANGSAINPARQRQVITLLTLLTTIEATAPDACLAMAAPNPDAAAMEKVSSLSDQLDRFQDALKDLARDCRSDTQDLLLTVSEAGMRQRNVSIIVLVASLVAALFMLRQFRATLRTLAENARLQADIARSQIELQSILDHAPVALYTKNKEARTVLANRRFEHNYGLTSGYAHGRRSAEFMPAENAARQDALDLAVIATGQPHEAEETVTTPQGVHYYWTARYPLRNDHHEVTLVCVVSNDITLIKQAQLVLARSRDELELQVKARTAELEAAQRQIVSSAHQAGRAEVASAVLHNIGNVLTGIVINQESVGQRAVKSQVALLRPLADALAKQEDPHTWIATHPKGRQIPAFILKITDALEKERAIDITEHEQIASSLDHIRHVLNSQQEHAKGTRFVETVNLPTLLEDALSMRASSFNRHSITIERHLPKLSWGVERHKLLQILINLIGNAIDAMHESRQRILTLAVAQCDAHAVITITDTGVGFTAETQAKLFSFGFTTKPTGHGFGLHSCAVEAQSMGGTITATSEGPGLGACFTLSIPLLS